MHFVQDFSVKILGVGYGQLIREAREARGWSQPELAARIGVDQTKVSRLENERRNVAIDVDLINALTLHLGISPSRLLEAMGVRLDVGPASRLPKQMVDDYLALGAAAQQLVTELVHGLRQAPEGSE